MSEEEMITDTEVEYHHCPFCGTDVHDGREPDGTRHWLSDCRPDLVNHEPGELCTWHGWGPYRDGTTREHDCYAYMTNGTAEWGSDHVHFYPDGPM